MTTTDPTGDSTSPLVVVTGANGLVGAATCRALIERGARVRGVVRRAGTTPDGVEEVVGEFHDAGVAAAAVAGASAVVSTVHPLGGDLETQHRVAVEGTPVLARAAAEAGVDRFVHVSTAAVYDRSPGVGDVDEHGALVGDDGGDYPVTKRDTDGALADVSGLTRVLLRPPAILGAGESSVWNSVRPAQIRDDASQRTGNPEQSFAWVHVDDLARIAADVATGVTVRVPGDDWRARLGQQPSEAEQQHGGQTLKRKRHGRLHRLGGFAGRQQGLDHQADPDQPAQKHRQPPRPPVVPGPERDVVDVDHVIGEEPVGQPLGEQDAGRCLR